MSVVTIMTGDGVVVIMTGDGVVMIMTGDECCYDYDW